MVSTRSRDYNDLTKDEAVTALQLIHCRKHFLLACYNLLMIQFGYQKSWKVDEGYDELEQAFAGEMIESLARHMKLVAKVSQLKWYNAAMYSDQLLVSDKLSSILGPLKPDATGGKADMDEILSGFDKVLGLNAYKESDERQWNRDVTTELLTDMREKCQRWTVAESQVMQLYCIPGRRSMAQRFQAANLPREIRDLIYQHLIEISRHDGTPDGTPGIRRRKGTKISTKSAETGVQPESWIMDPRIFGTEMAREISECYNKQTTA